MVNGKYYSLTFLLVLALFSLNLVYAISETPLESNRTLIMGSIYNSDFTQEISGVNIWFICNDNDVEVKSVYTDNSSFAVTFPSDLCPVGSFVDIGAYKEGYDFYGSGSVIHSCDESAYCLSGLSSENGTVNIVSLAVTNVNLKKSNSSINLNDFSSFVGGHGNLYKPVFNKTNSTSNVVVLDTEPELEENTPSNEGNIPDSSGVQNAENTNVSDDSAKGLSGVTGNFLASGASSWIALIVVLVASLLVYFLLKKGKQTQLPPKTSQNHSFY